MSLNSNKQLLGFIAFCVGLVFVYIYFFTHIYVEVEVGTDSDGFFWMYHADEKQPFQENRSFVFRIHNNKMQYSFNLTTLKSIKTLKSVRKLRIDLQNQTGRFFLKRIVIKQMGYQPVCFDTPEKLKKLKVMNGVEKLIYQPDGVLIIASAEKPQMTLLVQPKLDAKFFFSVLFFTIVAGFVLGIGLNSIPHAAEFGYVPYLMVFIGALIFTGSTLCKTMHADEYVHIRAGLYYADHWLPPEILDPAIEHTYSVYGRSRLNNYEIVYFLAGKIARLFNCLNLNNLFKLRLFNNLLFLVLIILCLRNRDYRILCLPAIISPQIWYVFAYFNSDAFAMFVTILVSYQVVSDGSRLNRMLAENTKPKTMFLNIAVLSPLFALLLLIKMNYYFFVIFLVLYFVLKLCLRKFSDPMQALKKVALIMLAVAVVFGARYTTDLCINGFNKDEKLAERQNTLAQRLYKAGTPLEQQHPYMQLKDRGVTIKEMFTKRNWGIISFGRAFGVYFFEPCAPDAYHRLILLLVILFSLYLTISILRSRDVESVWLLLFVIVCSLIMAAASFWASYTLGFQAHGRYLFPAFGMTGFLVLQALKALNKPILNFFTIGMFILSTYSFIFIGLLQLPKI